MSTDTKWLKVDDLPEVINCVRETSDKVWARYLPERTCTNKASHVRDFECSECFDYWPDFSPNTFHYCPNCGAKVVEV